VSEDRGKCPICGKAALAWEKEPDGNSMCVNGHERPTVEFLKPRLLYERICILTDHGYRYVIEKPVEVNLKPNGVLEVMDIDGNLHQITSTPLVIRYDGLENGNG